MDAIASLFDRIGRIASDRAIDPGALLFFVGGVLTLVATALLIGGAGHRRDAGRCRWRRRRRAPAMTAWTCTRCGVDAYSQDGRPPKDCKRALRPAPL